MKPIKCENCKMFYDGDKYESCPHCKASSTAENEIKAAEKEEPARSIRKTTGKFTEKRNTEKPVTEKPASAEDTGSSGSKVFGRGFFRKKEKIHEEVVSVEEVPAAPAVSVKPEPAEEVETERKVVSRTVPQSRTEPATAFNEPPLEETEEIRKPDPAFEEEPEEEEGTNAVPSIMAAVQQADSTSNSADEKTVAFYNFSNAIEPVVGWIICVEGEYMGESFSLKSGRNNIGRSLAMDIALAKEKSVSRERHAAITYEPNKMKFYIQSGESSGLTYVNDELIMMFTELNDYDVITLGASKFVFLRLCGPNFSWDNYS